MKSGFFLLNSVESENGFYGNRIFVAHLRTVGCYSRQKKLFCHRQSSDYGVGISYINYEYHEITSKILQQIF